MAGAITNKLHGQAKRWVSDRESPPKPPRPELPQRRTLNRQFVRIDSERFLDPDPEVLEMINEGGDLALIDGSGNHSEGTAGRGYYSGIVEQFNATTSAIEELGSVWVTDFDDTPLQLGKRYRAIQSGDRTFPLNVKHETRTVFVTAARRAELTGGEEPRMAKLTFRYLCRRNIGGIPFLTLRIRPSSNEPMFHRVRATPYYIYLGGGVYDGAQFIGVQDASIWLYGSWGVVENVVHATYGFDTFIRLRLPGFTTFSAGIDGSISPKGYECFLGQGGYLWSRRNTPRVSTQDNGTPPFWPDALGIMPSSAQSSTAHVFFPPTSGVAQTTAGVSGAWLHQVVP